MAAREVREDRERMVPLLEEFNRLNKGLHPVMGSDWAEPWN